MNKAFLLILLVTLAACDSKGGDSDSYGGDSDSYGGGHGHGHGHGPRQSRRFLLEFQYACRENVPFSSCTGAIQWNGRKIASLRPRNYGVQRYSSYVTISAGRNSLVFRGTGCSDSYGLTIDNVKLVRQGTNSNIVVNGGFEKPCVSKSWKIFNGIPGWQGQSIEVGWGSIYNCRWNSQVVELDANSNSRVSQSWNFNRNYCLI